MQSEAKIERKRKHEVIKLVAKIRRLKNKLISYGMTGKQSIDSILYQFLKAPKIDWTLPHNTVHFYQIQAKYHTDHNTAQLILLLNAIVPNWQTRNVVQYLHETLTYNALSFGIDLQISDDSSNEDGNDMTMLLIKAKKKNQQFGLKSKKRNHLQRASSNFLYLDANKDSENSDQDLKKKIHSNQKIQELKSQRKLTEEDYDRIYEPNENVIFVQQMSENLVMTKNNNNNNNHQNQYESDQQQEQMKKQVIQQNNEKPKRRYIRQYEFLEEEKLQKKVKK